MADWRIGGSGAKASCLSCLSIILPSHNYHSNQSLRGYGSTRVWMGSVRLPIHYLILRENQQFQGGGLFADVIQGCHFQ